jgi:hypothetical protein
MSSRRSRTTKPAEFGESGLLGLGDFYFARNRDKDGRVGLRCRAILMNLKTLDVSPRKTVLLPLSSAV